MNLVFEKERDVCSAYIDSSLHLGIAQSVSVVQDGITECFGQISCDGVIYREQFRAFWVFTKTKIKFIQRPGWRDTIRVRTFPVDNAGVRTHVNTEITDKNGSLLLLANQEACVLSLENHRPMRLTSLPYPKENFPVAVFSEPFEKFNAVFTDGSKVYEQRVYSQYIDMSKHTNNVEYVRLALNTFSDDFLQTHEVKELEVHYLGESKEGELLEVFRQDDDEYVFCRICTGGRIVFEMRISFS